MAPASEAMHCSCGSLDPRRKLYECDPKIDLHAPRCADCGGTGWIRKTRGEYLDALRHEAQLLRDEWLRAEWMSRRTWKDGEQSHPGDFAKKVMQLIDEIKREGDFAMTPDLEAIRAHVDRNGLDCGVQGGCDECLSNQVALLAEVERLHRELTREHKLHDCPCGHPYAVHDALLDPVIFCEECRK